MSIIAHAWLDMATGHAYIRAHHRGNIYTFTTIETVGFGADYRDACQSCRQATLKLTGASGTVIGATSQCGACGFTWRIEAAAADPMYVPPKLCGKTTKAGGKCRNEPFGDDGKCHLHTTSSWRRPESESRARAANKRFVARQNVKPVSFDELVGLSVRRFHTLRMVAEAAQ